MQYSGMKNLSVKEDALVNPDKNQVSKMTKILFQKNEKFFIYRKFKREQE